MPLSGAIRKEGESPPPIRKSPCDPAWSGLYYVRSAGLSKQRVSAHNVEGEEVAELGCYSSGGNIHNDHRYHFTIHGESLPQRPLYAAVALVRGAL